jgi:hypothetical protein
MSRTLKVAPYCKGSCHHGDVKADPHAKMVEGPEAWERFRVAMKTIIKVPKTALPPSPFGKRAKKTTKLVAPKS